jgi:hypothetical protein
LLRQHATATPAERAIIEPVIFSKAVDYRRDVKRGKVSAEDQAATNELLARYKPTTERKPRKKKSDGRRG